MFELALLIALIGIAARATGTVVVDGIAAARGSEPPSLVRTRQRHEAALARGETPDPRGGYMRRVIGDAVEVRNAKAAQKHEGRMRALRDRGPDAVKDYTTKYAKRLERRDKLGRALARFGQSSWEHTKKAAGSAYDTVQQKRAERKAERGQLDDAPTGDRQEQAADAVKDSTPAEPATGDAASVTDINSRRNRPADTESSTTNQQEDTDMANATMTHDGEITDVESGYRYADVMVRHLGKLTTAVRDMNETLKGNGEGLKAQVATIESAEESLTAAGFMTGKAIPKALNDASEVAPQAAEVLAGMAGGIPDVLEQLEQATEAFAKLKAAFAAQRSTIGESVTAQRANGTATKTKFYEDA